MDYERIRERRGSETRSSHPCDILYIVVVIVLVLSCISSLTVSSIALSKIGTLEKQVREIKSESGPLRSQSSSNPSDRDVPLESKYHFELPAKAKRLADGIHGLGQAYIPHLDTWVHGYAFMLRNDTSGSSNKRSKRAGVPNFATGSCWSTLGDRKAKLRSNMKYAVDTHNTNGLSSDYILSTIARSMSNWDCHTGYKIFGDYDPSLRVNGADTGSPDGVNEILFGSLPWSGTIAVTITWIDWSTGTIVEFDQIYNEVDYRFCDGGSNCMHFPSINTHELGHALGLGDEYDPDCSDVTMYGYASNGETKKSTLATQDIEGEHYVYGDPTDGTCTSKQKNDAPPTLHSDAITLVCTSLPLLYSLSL
jgi:hypothetical protein